MSRLSLSKYLKNRLKIYIYWLFRCCLTFTVLRWKKLIKRTWANLKTVMFTNRLLNIYIFPCVNELLNKSSIKYYITPAEKKNKKQNNRRTMNVSGHHHNFHFKAVGLFKFTILFCHMTVHSQYRPPLSSNSLRLIRLFHYFPYTDSVQFVICQSYCLLF